MTSAAARRCASHRPRTAAGTCIEPGAAAGRREQKAAAGRWSGSGTTSAPSGSRTAGSSSPGTRASWSSCGTRCPASGSSLEVTEGQEGDRFLRADAVEVLEASPDRVAPPCPFAGPGRCGGCDFQHVDARRPSARSRRRSSPSSCSGWPGSTWRSTVEPVPGRPGRRARLAHPRAVGGHPVGGAGLRKHRSHDVVPVDDCRIAHPGLPGRRPTPSGPTPPAVEAIVSSTGEQLRLVIDRATAATFADGPLVLHRAGRRPRAGRSPAPASGRCTPAPPTRWSPRCSTGSTRSRGSGPPTSTPAWGCSRRRWPSAVGPTGHVRRRRVRPRRRRRRRGEPRRPAPGLAGRRTGSTGRSAPTSSGRATSSCSTRRGPGRSGTSSRRSRAGATGGRLRRLRPGGAGPRRGVLRRARLRAGLAARLRPVPDDAPRGVRCAPCEERLWPAVT